MFCQRIVDQEVVLNLLRESIVSKGTWVRDPGSNSCTEMTYMGIRNWRSSDQDLGTGVFKYSIYSSLSLTLRSAPGADASCTRALHSFAS
jgi:hypothetical protein